MTRPTNTKFACGPFFLLALMVGTMAMPAQANGAGLLDWLFPRRAERQARRWSRATQAYRPISSTGYNGTNTSYYGGNFAGGTNFGSGGYYPSYGSWNGWGYQTNAGSNYYSTYRPTTVYRTQWSPVPVTTYSPTAGGAYQSPCTSHEWQALRVPYTSYQPGTAYASTAPSLSAVGGVGGAGSSCCGTATTTNYGSGWQAVSPATAAPATSAFTRAATTAGYAPQADYANATDWTPAQSETTAQASDWQPVPSTTSRSAASLGWHAANDEREPTAASRRPRLEDDRRESYYRDQLTQIERSRAALAREVEDAKREIEDAARRERKSLEELRSRDDDQSYRRNNTDRFSDWHSDWQRSDREETRSVSRYDDRYQDSRDEWRPTATYRPPTRPSVSDLDRQRSEYYRRLQAQEAAARDSATDRNAYRPMLDDGWSYDKTDTRAPRETGYDWRTTSNDRSFSTRSETVPASIPNHQPRASAPRGVMPLLLKPIPETNGTLRSDVGPGTLKLLGPKDRTASLPKTSRWQAIPAKSTTASSQLQWRSASN